MAYDKRWWWCIDRWQRTSEGNLGSAVALCDKRSKRERSHGCQSRDNKENGYCEGCAGQGAVSPSHFCNGAGGGKGGHGQPAADVSWDKGH